METLFIFFFLITKEKNPNSFTNPSHQSICCLHHLASPSKPTGLFAPSRIVDRSPVLQLVLRLSLFASRRPVLSHTSNNSRVTQAAVSVYRRSSPSPLVDHPSNPIRVHRIRAQDPPSLVILESFFAPSSS